jgi:folate-binding protein YgfZ
MMIALPGPQLLEIAGADAVNFAHAQFSSDVQALANGHWQWSAWLSAQGRVRAFFHLLRQDHDRLRLLLRGGDAEELCAALLPYVLRAKVTLRVLGGLQAFGVDDASAAGAAAMALPGLPARWLVLRESAGEAVESAEALANWRLADIRAGLPELGPALRDQFLPQWLGLDLLDAVSVRKGCYPGQEIMSRLHFKGGSKRHLYRLEMAAADPPAPGTALYTPSGENAGHVVNAERDGGGHTQALASLLDSAVATPLQTSDSTPPDSIVKRRFA